jgi:hypothetical protein
LSKTCSKCGFEKDEFVRNVCGDCIKIRNAAYYLKNRNKVLSRAKEYYQENKDKILERNREYANNNDRSEYYKMYYDGRSESKKQYSVKRYQENREEIIKKQGKYHKRKLQENPELRLRENISRLVRFQITKNGSTKSGSKIFDYLPYSLEELKYHLESLFQEGMTWDNYGKWHIDHIISQSKLPFSSMEDENFLKCWSLDNLQPLWAEDNFKKGRK